MNKRILLVLNTLSSGGAERAASVLSTKLSEYCDVDIMINGTDRIDYEYSGRIISLGIKDRPDRTGTFYQIAAFLRRMKMLKRLRKREKYAAVISFCESANIANILTRRHGGKSVITFRNMISEKMKNPRYRLFIVTFGKILYKKADAAVSVSRKTAEEAARFYGLSDVTVIENGVDVETVRKKAEEDIPDIPFKRTVIAAGRLSPQKNFELLIRSFAQVSESFPDTGLIILGEGSERKKLETLNETLGLSDRVLMPGFMKNPYPVIKHADVFCCSSRYEGYSNVILEALALGRAVISTDHESGARDILSPESRRTGETEYGEYGVLIPAADSEEMFGEATKRLLTDDVLRREYEEKAEKRAEMLGIDEKVKLWRKVIER